MREVTLDLTPFEEKHGLHDYLKQTLDFPFYYGGNLDALYDVLGSITQATRLHLQYSAQPKGKMVEYLPRLLRVFRDAAADNYNLEITEEQLPR